MAFQQTIIVGNLGKDAEQRYLPSGVSVVSFNVAVNETWNDRQSGEKREKTTWFRVNAWAKLGESLAPYLVQGKQVMVTGTIEASAFLGKDGEARASLELRADQIRLLGGRGAGSSNGADEYAPAGEPALDEIPF